MNIAELNLNQAQCVGNVELKSAVGTLPQRLTIEKLCLQTSSINCGNPGQLYPFIYGSYIWTGRGLYSGNPSIREFSLATMQELRNVNNADQYGYAPFGYAEIEQFEMLYMWMHPNNLKRVAIDTLATQLTATPTMNPYARPFIWHDPTDPRSNRLFVLTAWGPGCGIAELNTEDFSVIETFGTTKINTYATFLYTEDCNNFYWGYVDLHRYAKSTDTDVNLGKTIGEDLSSPYQGYGTYGGHYGTIYRDGNDWLWVWLPYILRYNPATLVNKEVHTVPTIKFGNAGGWNVSNSLPWAMFDTSERSPTKGIWVAVQSIQAQGFYAARLIRINMNTNNFTDSYAGWSLSGLTGTLKKIIVKGGFSRGYGYNYAEAKQIKVEYYTDHWIEYDIDSMPDINLDLSAISQIKIGLQERYLFGDRFPYVSKVGLLYEPATDTTPPAMPSGLTVDEPPARPTGLSITEAGGGGGGGQTK